MRAKSVDRRLASEQRQAARSRRPEIVKPLTIIGGLSAEQRGVPREQAFSRTSKTAAHAPRRKTEGFDVNRSRGLRDHEGGRDRARQRSRRRRSDHRPSSPASILLAALPGLTRSSPGAAALHTPLMAFTNAISGVSVVASILSRPRLARSHITRSSRDRRPSAHDQRRRRLRHHRPDAEDV